MVVASYRSRKNIVLDNASFHKWPELINIVNKAFCSLLVLPTYSSDLNPIEHHWAYLKSALLTPSTSFSLQLLFHPLFFNPAFTFSNSSCLDATLFSASAAARLSASVRLCLAAFFAASAATRRCSSRSCHLASPI